MPSTLPPTRCLAPLAQAAIEPKISAPVRKFYVQRGSRVKAGQLLATLENNDLAAAAMDNKGSYMAAQAAYDTATKAQVPEDTLKAESDLAQAKANLDLNLSIVKSRKQLFAEGAIPGRDLDTANAALVQAQAAYDAAAKHLESVRSVSREAALKAAQGQLTSAEGKYKGAAGPGELLGDSQPHQRRGDRPAAVRRRNRGRRRAADYGDGHLQPAGQDAHGAEPGAADEGGRRGDGAACPEWPSRLPPRFRSSVRRSTRAAPPSKSGSRSTTRPERSRWARR